MTTEPPSYRLINHTADLGIEIRGESLKELFENGAKALMHLVVKAEGPLPTSSMAISVYGEDLPDLMVRWLGELVYLLEGENRVVNSVNIGHISETRLKANLETIPFDPVRHEILHEIKAVTYHQIRVEEKEDHWESRIIFDL
jgi:SHS2 domain-containing protein